MLTFMDASMSTVPTSRSSVTPSGICTKGADRTRVGGGPAPSFSRRPSYEERGDTAEESLLRSGFSSR